MPQDGTGSIPGRCPYRIESKVLVKSSSSNDMERRWAANPIPKNPIAYPGGLCKTIFVFIKGLYYIVNGHSQRSQKNDS